MFHKARFGPVAIVGARVPRIFTYENVLDTLQEIKQPGYFNNVRTVLTHNSRIEVIAADYHASLFVMGVVDRNICLYQDAIQCPRGEAILTPEIPTKIQPKKPTKAKVPMFLKDRFGPVAVGNIRVPRIFIYENIQDSLHEIKQPGYFNDVKTVLASNSRIEVISADYHATIFVMGVVDGMVCVYKDAIKCPRREALLPKIAAPGEPQKIQTKKPGKAKKGKAA